MAERTILTKGDETLTKVSRKVDSFDERLATLAHDMTDTLITSNGVGLAAPQVGVLRRIVIIDVGNEDREYRAFVNPEIIEQSGEQREVEGCLSIPGKWGKTVRPKTVKVRAQNEKGEFFEMEGTDLLARAFCHEIDHLNGILFESRVFEWTEGTSKKQ